MVSQSTINSNFTKDSILDVELNDILEKINKGEKLSLLDIDFIQNFNSFDLKEFMDYSHLSKNQVVEKIELLLKKSKTVICDLNDKYGKIGEEIKEIKNSFEDGYATLTFKNRETFQILDSFLYKITFDIKKNIYTLDSSGEYYEKINNENT
jgi:hypothetical protein